MGSCVLHPADYANVLKHTTSENDQSPVCYRQMRGSTNHFSGTATYTGRLDSAFFGRGGPSSKKLLLSYFPALWICMGAMQTGTLTIGRIMRCVLSQMICEIRWYGEGRTPASRTLKYV